MMKQLKNKFKPKNKYQYNIEVTLIANTSPGTIRNNSPSYLDTDVSTSEPSLNYLNDGAHDLWCIDREIGFALNFAYKDYYCFSYLEIAQNLIKNPLKKIGTSNPAPIAYQTKLDNITWLINQNFFGIDLFNTGFVVSIANYQQAIWYLLNQYNSSFIPNANVVGLVNMANLHGEKFMANAALSQRQGIIISNSKITAEGNLSPRTQPYVLMVKTCELHLGPRKKILRKISNFKQYIHIDSTSDLPTTVRGLTPGFEYFIKNKHNRTMTKIVLKPGESYEAA